MKTFAVIFVAAALARGGTTSNFAEWSGQAGRLVAQGRYEAAEPLYRKALEAAEEARDRAIARANLGTVLRLRGRFQEAEPLLAGAVSELRAMEPRDTLSLGRALGNLASVYEVLYDLERAETAARDAIELFCANPQIAESERRGQELILAGIYIDARRYAEAERLLTPIGAHGSATQAATAYSSLAAVAIPLGRIDDAEQYGREAVERARAAYPSNHPAVAAALNNLAQAYRFGGKYREAEAAYREAIEIWRTALGENHPDTARGLMNLAALYHERGREAGAEEMYAKAGEIFARTLGAQHPQTLAARNELAEVMRAQRRFSEAERLGRATLAALEKAVGDDDPRLERALENRARLLKEMRRPGEAGVLAKGVRER